MKYEYKIQVMASGTHRLFKTANNNTDLEIILGDFIDYGGAINGMQRAIEGKKYYFDATGALIPDGQ